MACMFSTGLPIASWISRTLTAKSRDVRSQSASKPQHIVSFLRHSTVPNPCGKEIWIKHVDLRSSFRFSLWVTLVWVYRRVDLRRLEVWLRGEGAFFGQRFVAIVIRVDLGGGVQWTSSTSLLLLFNWFRPHATLLHCCSVVPWLPKLLVLSRRLVGMEKVETAYTLVCAGKTVLSVILKWTLAEYIPSSTRSLRRIRVKGVFLFNLFQIRQAY
jgi:hypothetical protein